MSDPLAYIAMRIDLVRIVTKRSARLVSMASCGTADAIRNIQRAERQGRPSYPRCDTLNAIARQLGVAVEWLMFGGTQVAA